MAEAAEKGIHGMVLQAKREEAIDELWHCAKVSETQHEQLTCGPQFIASASVKGVYESSGASERILEI